MLLYIINSVRWVCSPMTLHPNLGLVFLVRIPPSAGKQIWKVSCSMIFHAFFSCTYFAWILCTPSTSLHRHGHNMYVTETSRVWITWGDIWDFQLLKSWKKDSSQICEVTCYCFTWQPCWSWCQPQILEYLAIGEMRGAVGNKGKTLRES